jgi:hypothetical protein
MMLATKQMKGIIILSPSASFKTNSVKNLCICVHLSKTKSFVAFKLSAVHLFALRKGQSRRGGALVRVQYDRSALRRCRYGDAV